MDSIAVLKKKTFITLSLSIIAALINIGLNIWLIPLYGYTAGSVTTVIAYLLYLVLSIMFSRKYMKLQVDWLKIGKIIIATITMVSTIMVLNVVPVFNNVGGFLLKMVFGAVAYVVVGVLTKAIDLKEMRRLFNR